jgi:8-amino-3,8-dideoxy-alpha-D-manno-octulosonate transaminase
VMHYVNQAFAISDAIMSRCISSSISLLWDEAQAQERGTKMAEVLKSIVAKNMIKR